MFWLNFELSKNAFTSDVVPTACAQARQRADILLCFLHGLPLDLPGLTMYQSATARHFFDRMINDVFAVEVGGALTRMG